MRASRPSGRLDAAILAIALATSYAYAQPPLNDCEQLAALLTELEATRLRYSDTHPVVMQLESKIERLTGELQSAAPGVAMEHICPGLEGSDD